MKLKQFILKGFIPKLNFGHVSLAIHSPYFALLLNQLLFILGNLNVQCFFYKLVTHIIIFEGTHFGTILKKIKHYTRINC